MGAGLAGVLSQHEVSVLTSLEGRSSASVARAQAAGMRSVALNELAGADVILSVMPPAEALPFARRMAPILQTAARKPLFVDCNAISPNTLHDVEAVIVATGTTFADVGIIGMPPKPGSPQPRLYSAGGGLELLMSLNQCGLDVRSLEGPAGTASALKMAYGGITKGLIAISSAMILGASRSEVAVYLRREFAQSEPQLFDSLSRRIRDMLPKAYRWVAEMEEISDFLSEDPASSEVYQGIAKLYDRLAQDVAGEAREADALTRFFDVE
jgi:L-threonate 2-dehydrogenase